MSKTNIEHYPGGLSTASGGTRTQIKTSRPWQVELQPDPENCPFCNEEQTLLRQYSEERDCWQEIENLATPFYFHHLFIPPSCRTWSIEDVRNLGGRAKIEMALILAHRTMTEMPIGKFFIEVHVGYSAGQNIFHPHWHLIKPLQNGRVQNHRQFRSENNLVIDQNGIRIFAEGQRAGQLSIVNNNNRQFGEMRSDLAFVLHRLIGANAEGFRSTQGLPPDYMIWLEVEAGETGTHLTDGFFLPILNNMGGTEFAAMRNSSYPMIIPWSHDMTTARLRWYLSKGDIRGTAIY